jgi:hypothetical protein
MCSTTVKSKFLFPVFSSMVFDPRTVQPVAQSLYRLSYPAHSLWSTTTTLSQHICTAPFTAVYRYSGHRNRSHFSHTRWHGSRGCKAVTDCLSCARNCAHQNTAAFKMHDFGDKYTDCITRSAECVKQVHCFYELQIRTEQPHFAAVYKTTKL